MAIGRRTPKTTPSAETLFKNPNNPVQTLPIPVHTLNKPVQNSPAAEKFRALRLLKK
jgi:hypothetical protein